MQIGEPAAAGAALEGDVGQSRPGKRGNDRVGVTGEPPLVFAYEEQVDVGEHLSPGRQRAVANEFERIQ